MAFCYVNALFQESIKCDCPDEVVKIIKCYVKSMRLLKRVSDQLDICPRMSQFEQWEKEAQAFVNTKALRDRLLTLERWTRVDRDRFMPHRVGGITRWMLEARYVNHFVYKHVKNQLGNLKSVFGKRFRKDKRWIEFQEPNEDNLKQVVQREVYGKVDEVCQAIGFTYTHASGTDRVIEMLIHDIVDARLDQLNEQSFEVKPPHHRARIFASNGNRRAFSRHPLMLARLSNCTYHRLHLTDWTKMLVLKDAHAYPMDNRGLYYIEENNVVRPR